MNETEPFGQAEAPQGTPGPEAARMSPFARVFNVLFSPGAVFDDVRRSARGWWAPILIGGIVTAVFGTIYVAKYDMALVVKEQIKDSAAMKIVSNLMGPEKRDLAVAQAVAQVQATPTWQMEVAQWGQSIGGWAFIVWFFAFLYGVMAMAMGWLGDAKGSKLFISLGLIAAIGVFLIVLTSVLKIAQAAGAPRGAEAAGPAGPPVVPTPTWSAVVGTIAGLLCAGAIFWVMSRLAREEVFGRIIAVVALGAVPGIISGLVGIVIVLIKTPDATPFEEMVPSTLTALLGLKGGGALASLGSSLGLFTIWSIVLTIMGLAKALGRKMGEAAALVLIPWGIWVIGKAAVAALLG